MRELKRIHQKDWIAGKRLTADGSVIKYNASNAGGYTIEAELDIIPNGFAEPDFMGWEVKQHGVPNFSSKAGRITLMTPEPTEGYYNENGAEEFVRKFGYPDMRGRADRLNFGGVHIVNERCSRTGLTMILQGYDCEKKIITDGDGGICLVTDTKCIAAKWPFTGIISHWNRKHAKAVYVPSMCNEKNARRYYKYGSVVRLGNGTDVLLLLGAMFDGKVYYNPGIKVENISSRPKVKRRSQFRINSVEIPAFYKQMTSESVIKN